MAGAVPLGYEQQDREVEAGITGYVCSTKLHFSGVLKRRYTDFLVNEILPSGQVVHLDNTKAPTGKPKATKPKAETEVSTPSSTAPPDKAKDAGDQQPRSSFTPHNLKADDNDTKTSLPASQLSPASGSLKKPSDESQLSPQDETELLEYFDADVLSEIVALYRQVVTPGKTNAKNISKVKSSVMSDRPLRTKMHSSMRRIFSSRLETSTDSDGAIVVSAAPKSGQRSSGDQYHNKGLPKPRTKSRWEEFGGDHVHFSLHKENKDTMEIVAFLARQLNVNPKSFQFAGTKDRRAVTVQRVSVYRVLADRLAGLNRALRGSRLGNFEYHPQGLELGELTGNEFIITLRDCRFPETNAIASTEGLEEAQRVVELATQKLRERGFLNFYGLQRFGTFSAKTDTIGVKMLQGDYKAACDDILSYSEEALAAARDPLSAPSDGPVSSDDKARAHALNSFKETGKSYSALNTLPRKYSAEAALIRHLGAPERSNDYQGALRGVPRNLRLMYVHAYQSLVWNTVAAERWKRFGDAVIEGDLVMIKDADPRPDPETEIEEFDESGDPIVHADADGLSGSSPNHFPRARPLSKEEASSGIYTIFDIVLPTPGFDILYPANAIGTFYTDFMSSTRGGGLDPHDMRRQWRDISLSGNYRPLLARPLGDGPFEVQVKTYTDDNEQMVETDVDRLKNRSEAVGKWQEFAKANADAVRGTTKGNEQPDAVDEAEGKEPAPSKVAVILKLQLGTSQYATMALRELMGPGGVQVYKPDFGGGR
ncbi:MAG: hypothetical protein M1833_002066 [Piccolia ochrophora]|nr:MAG: hypothetical protein M1833_002066 [Piccolia ochrophora]